MRKISNNIKKVVNDKLNEEVYIKKLKNGLTMYFCKRKNFKRKIGMFGTKYGSLVNTFIDKETNEKITVPYGVAHFLEHKLFEKEEDNAMDLFSKIGVDSNAYTTYDHTLYYFETTDKFKESIKLLIKLIKEPYFTDENVEKEKGIIAQEIMMYEDDPYYNVYFNTIKGMYNVNNVKMDVLGTIDTISKITKETLYTCYNTFYNLNNMFFIVVGDEDIEETFDLIENELSKYQKRGEESFSIKKFEEIEPRYVSKNKVYKKKDIINPQICIGYKLQPKSGIDIIKRMVMSDIIADMYFSKITDYYKSEYNNGIIQDKVDISYEAENSFAHIIFSCETNKLEEFETDFYNYLEKIKKEDINEELFLQVKNNKISSLILSSDYISNSYKRIIDSILTNTDVFEELYQLENITSKDIKEFLNELDNECKVVSILDK